MDHGFMPSFYHFCIDTGDQQVCISVKGPPNPAVLGITGSHSSWLPSIARGYWCHSPEHSKDLLNRDFIIWQDMVLVRDWVFCSFQSSTYTSMTPSIDASILVTNSLMHSHTSSVERKGLGKWKGLAWKLAQEEPLWVRQCAPSDVCCCWLILKVNSCVIPKYIQVSSNFSMIQLGEPQKGWLC